MVHIAPIPPWRRRVQRIVGGLLAALGVVVLVIAIIALRQPNGHQASLRTSGVAESSASTPATSPTPTPTVSSSAPSSSSAAPTSTAPTTPSTDPLKAVPLVVLNNTSKTGLADTAAGRFKAGGWTVTSTGNLSNDILSTCAYYDPNVANAQAAATELKAEFPAIKRVAAKFSGLPAGPIIVVLTSDYS